MKMKTGLGLLLGLAGACAACCALPLLAAAVGGVGLLGGLLAMGPGVGEWLIAGLLVLALAAAWGWRAWQRRRAAPSCAVGGCACR
ncbi:hypothetical protein [Aquabacterium sp.]|uniref:hypothetical protein n=1 Tax=Aquabacterium sp. TaxID=1872578 RepID=UPI00378324DC